jgi:hypothetical protein
MQAADFERGYRKRLFGSAHVAISGAFSLALGQHFEAPLMLPAGRCCKDRRRRTSGTSAIETTSMGERAVGQDETGKSARRSPCPACRSTPTCLRPVLIDRRIGKRRPIVVGPAFNRQMQDRRQQTLQHLAALLQNRPVQAAAAGCGAVDDLAANDSRAGDRCIHLPLFTVEDMVSTVSRAAPDRRSHGTAASVARRSNHRIRVRFRGGDFAIAKSRPCRSMNRRCQGLTNSFCAGGR